MVQDFKDKEAEFNKKQVAVIAEDIKAKTDSKNSPKQLGDFYVDDPFAESSEKELPSLQGHSDVRFSDVYTDVAGELKSKYSDYSTYDLNQEERHANQQSTGDKWQNGLLKFLGKTGTGVLGGTVGVVTGLGNYLKEGNMDAIYSSDFQNWLEDLNEKMDNKLPNYYTEHERNEGFIDSLDNANFVANDLLGGLSFLTSALISESLWAAATGGASIPSSVARFAARTGAGGFKAAAKLAKANKAAAKPLKSLLRGSQFEASSAVAAGKAAKIANTVRFTYTSAGYESTIEASSYKKEATEKYLSMFEEQNGRLPNADEWSDFKEDLTTSTNALYTTNLALVGSSNLAIIGNIFDVKSPLTGITKGFNKSLFGIGHKTVTKEGRKVLEALKPTTLQKFTGTSYSVLKSPVIEGVWEEGMQAVSSSSAENWLLSRYDADATKQNLDLVEAAYDGIVHTYGSKEGWKEIGLGMIIGLFGGGMSTGFKFNDVSNRRKQNALNIADLNTYSAENTLEAFRVQNQMAYASKKKQEAEDKNDLLGKDLATRSMMYTNARANERFGRDDAELDFEAALEGLEDSYFESIGLDTKAKDYAEQKQEVKDSLLETYKESQEDYRMNIKAAEYLVGIGGIAGVENTEELVEAVAYNLSMGKHADEFRDKTMELIIEEMTGEMATKVVKGVKTTTTLSNAHKRTRQRFYYHKKRAKKSERDLENALEKLRNLETQSRENNQGLEQKIRKAQQDVESYTNRMNEEKKLMRETFAMAQAENTFGDKVVDTEIISDEDLLNIDENLKIGEEYLENLKETNPTKYESISKLFNEYHKANYTARQFNKTVQGLAHDKLKLKEYNDMLTKAMYKGKKNNEFTQQWIDENLKTYQEGKLETLQSFTASQAISQADRRKEIEDKLYTGATLTEEEEELYQMFKDETDHAVSVRKTAEELMEKGFLEGDANKFYEENKAEVDAYINEKEKGDNIDTSPKEEATKAKTLRERVEEAIKKNSAIQSYVGEDYDGVTSEQPTMEEVERFEELEAIKKKKRTEEESTEHEKLLNKLAMWRIVDGAVDPEGYSLADMIKAAKQEETTPKKDDTKGEVTEEEAVNIKVVDEKDGSRTIDNVDFIQTYENVKVKVNESLKSFVFSHLNVGTILKNFSIDQVEYKAANGKEMKALTKTKLNEFGSREGTTFRITLQDGTKVHVTVGEKGRLQIPLGEFERIQDTLGMKLVNSNLTKNTYFDVYKEVDRGGEMVFVPMKSEFKLDTISGAEEVLLEPQELEKMNEGEKLHFRINMKSVYNNDLLDRIQQEGLKGKQKEEVINDIKSNLEIYVLNGKGKVVGVVKAAPKNLNPNSDSQTNHWALRQLAAMKFIEQSETALNTPIDLDASVPVSRVLLGTPDLVLRDTAEGLTPDNIEFTDRALEKVLDFGYMEGDEIFTNKGTDISKVLMNPVKKLGKGEKVPFIIFKHGDRKVAYPVSLISTQDFSSIEEIEKINNSKSLSASEKIVRINEVLLNAGISPKKYHLMTTEAKEIDNKIDEIVKELSELNTKPDISEWVENGDKSLLKEQARISIDLENRPLKSPKLAVAFDKAILPEIPGVKKAGANVSVPNTNQVNNQINNC